MVEGPGTTNNGRIVRSLVGLRVAGLSGHAAAEASKVRGMVLVDVLVSGKQLFLIFSADAGAVGDAVGGNEYVVRVHFGMNGSTRVNGAAPVLGKASLALRVHFADVPPSSAAFYESTVRGSGPGAAQTIRANHAAVRPRDVCAPEGVWDASAAAAALAAVGGALVADAVLNQAVLPGCGNIIKNEALHLARVDPRRRVASLVPAEIEEVLRRVRVYSVAWQRKGRPPPPRVYDRTSCADCGGRVGFCKLGEDLSRPTFWCEACLAKGAPPAAAAGNDDAKRISSRKRPRAALSNWLNGDTAGSPASSRPSPPFSDRATSSGHCLQPQAPAPPWSKPGLPASTPAVGEAAVNGPRLEAGAAPRLGARPGARREFLLECCRVHGKGRVALRRVRKAGPTAGRLFVGCRAPGCSYFAWADGAFPRCGCAGSGGRSSAVAILRTSQTTATGGRPFFSCGAGGGGSSGSSGGGMGGGGKECVQVPAGCKYFSWAAESHLSPLGDLFTPLL